MISQVGGRGKNKTNHILLCFLECKMIFSVMLVTKSLDFFVLLLPYLAQKSFVIHTLSFSNYQQEKWLKEGKKTANRDTIKHRNQLRHGVLFNKFSKYHFCLQKLVSKEWEKTFSRISEDVKKSGIVG